MCFGASICWWCNLSIILLILAGVVRDKSRCSNSETIDCIEKVLCSIFMWLYFIYITDVQRYK